MFLSKIIISYYLIPEKDIRLSLEVWKSRRIVYYIRTYRKTILGNLDMIIIKVNVNEKPINSNVCQKNNLYERDELFGYGYGVVKCVP